MKMQMFKVLHLLNDCEYFDETWYLRSLYFAEINYVFNILSLESVWTVNGTSIWLKHSILLGIELGYDPKVVDTSVSTIKAQFPCNLRIFV